MKTTYDFLKKCETYYLATAEGKQPRVRPFGSAHIYDGRLYIQTGKIKDVSKQIASNPNIEICAFDGDEWIRIEARAVEDDSREARLSMLAAYPSLKGMYETDDGNCVVYYLKNATSRIYSFSGPTRTTYF